MSTAGPTLSSAQLALAVKRLQADRPAAELANSNPVAIVGIGCRFPGNVRSPRDYWRLLREGVDAISKAPVDRWDDSYYDPDPQSPGKMNSCWGGFLSGVDLFDPLLFGISPREAPSIDPQQRLLLEVAWEAIWDSGRAPESLPGSRTGVFASTSKSDYERLLFEHAAAIGPHSCTGGYRSVASGRISFLLDLRGPSISIDTACSSSLSAVHAACQSLRMGECDFALAGGVTLHLLPGHYIGLAKLGMLSPDGRCRTFDASANGFVPGEGCGVVALKRLADALSEGDRIYAVIRGTALNQDGRTNVLTAPNGLAQQAVIRAALQNGRVRASDITYVETHGTGTELGDPIEVEALAETLGAGSAPCALGAVKTNVGHLEAAAGVAGLIKAALALEHQEIPGNLHFEKLNPNISLEGTRFYLPSATTPWPRAGAPRFAGVSSFGFSGTNAHVVLEESPRVSKRDPEQAGWSRLLTLSARTPEALRSFAEAYRSFLEQDGEIPLYDICHTAACRRGHLEERAALVAAGREELCALLEQLIENRSGPNLARGRASRAPEIVFVCSGQGSQWARMGAGLLEREPVFRAAIEECDGALRPHAGWSLVERLCAPEPDSKLAGTESAQPAIFAIEVALARLWQSWGVRPAAVIGHSAGEIAAAAIAGVLTLDEAARIVVARGRLMQAATGLGKMATVHLPVARVLAELASRGPEVSIGAVNSPQSTVISGDTGAVEELLHAWRESGIGCRPLPVNYAFHSAQMRPYSEELVRLLGRVEARAGQIPFVSTVLGRFARGEELDSQYWGRNILQTVLFGAAVRAAMDRGYDTFLEIGPHPVLLGPVGECLAAEGRAGTLLPSMRRSQDELSVLLSSLAALYASGCAIAWRGVFPQTAPPVAVPPYPYQRTRYWLDAHPAPAEAQLHPLLGVRLRSPSLRDTVFETRVDTAALPYLADHRIAGRVLLPMTAFLEMAGRAAREAAGTPKALLDVTILEPLQIPPEGATVQAVLDEDALRIFSLDGERWKLHAAARIAPPGEPRDPLDPAAFPAGDASAPQSHYARFDELGFEFGPAFRTIRNLLVKDGEAWASLRLGESGKRGSGRYLFHPALLDGCLQTAVAVAQELDGAYLPFSIDRFELYRPAATEVRAHATSRISAAGDLRSDIDICNLDGVPVARVAGLCLRRSDTGSKIYRTEWRDSPRPAAHDPGAGEFLILSDHPDSAASLAAALRKLGRDARLERPGQPLRINLETRAVIRLEPDVPGALSLVQELAKQLAPPQLWLITREAAAAVPGDACSGLAQAPVWGLARTIALEHPDLVSVRVDLDAGFSAWDALAAGIAGWDGETEIAFRADRRLTPALVQVSPSPAQPAQWTIPSRGSIEALTLAPLERRAPRAGQVEIEIEASALNFRDVLNVLGMYPGDAGPPGIDFCGRVTRAGAGVSLRPGERVMGLAWGSLAGFVTTSAALVVPAPDGWTPHDAAAVPNVFLTARHCLVRLARIRSGEKILIHAAAGGVGLAAVQIALQVGAEVFATAGSEEKRARLRSLGVSHTFSSRTLDFAGEILAVTGGKGVDVVLNSLAGEFIPAGFAALRPAGRFVEIGKNRIWTSEQAAALDKPVEYFVVDLGATIESHPDLIQEDLLALRRGFEAGSLRPLPVQLFDFSEAPSAFRFMAQAKHIGKIVLRHPGSPHIRADAAYLITGGMGAIGLEMMRWLIARGARHLVLVGRSAPSPQASEQIRQARETGAQIEIRAADISRREEMEAVIAGLEHPMPPLAGVIHAAGVLDDGVVMNQTAQRIARVMAPKTAGAWNLHGLTAALPLDFFILCSSIASVTGSPGQAGYAAGNAFLDALAHYRRARGLPALSVNWGPWGNAGMAARVSGPLSLRGLKPMPAEECLRRMEQALASGHAQVAIADADWTQFPSASGWLPESRKAHAQEPSAPDDLSRRLEATPPGNRAKFLVEYLCRTARAILGLSSSYPVNERQPLTQIGLDSLMATEFRNHLAAALHRPLSSTLLFDYPTIAALADFLEPSRQPPPAPRSDALLETVEMLSDQEAEALLRTELERG